MLDEAQQQITLSDTQKAAIKEIIDSVKDRMVEGQSVYYNTGMFGGISGSKIHVTKKSGGNFTLKLDSKNDGLTFYWLGSRENGDYVPQEELNQQRYPLLEKIVAEKTRYDKSTVWENLGLSCGAPQFCRDELTIEADKPLTGGDQAEGQQTQGDGEEVARAAEEQRQAEEALQNFRAIKPNLLKRGFKSNVDIEPLIERVITALEAEGKFNETALKEALEALVALESSSKAECRLSPQNGQTPLVWAISVANTLKSLQQREEELIATSVDKRLLIHAIKGKVQTLDHGVLSESDKSGLLSLEGQYDRNHISTVARRVMGGNEFLPESLRLSKADSGKDLLNKLSTYLDGLQEVDVQLKVFKDSQDEQLDVEPLLTELQKVWEPAEGILTEANLQVALPKAMEQFNAQPQPQDPQEVVEQPKEVQSLFEILQDQMLKVHAEAMQGQKTLVEPTLGDGEGAAQAAEEQRVVEKRQAIKVVLAMLSRTVLSEYSKTSLLEGIDTFSRGDIESCMNNVSEIQPMPEFIRVKYTDSDMEALIKLQKCLNSLQKVNNLMEPLVGENSRELQTKEVSDLFDALKEVWEPGEGILKADVLQDALDSLRIKSGQSGQITLQLLKDKMFEVYEQKKALNQLDTLNLHLLGMYLQSEHNLEGLIGGVIGIWKGMSAGGDPTLTAALQVLMEEYGAELELPEQGDNSPLDWAVSIAVTLVQKQESAKEAAQQLSDRFRELSGKDKVITQEQIRNKMVEIAEALEKFSEGAGSLTGDDVTPLQTALQELQSKLGGQLKVDAKKEEESLLDFAERIAEKMEVVVQQRESKRSCLPCRSRPSRANRESQSEVRALETEGVGDDTHTQTRGCLGGFLSNAKGAKPICKGVNGFMNKIRARKSARVSESVGSGVSAG